MAADIQIKLTYEPRSGDEKSDFKPLDKPVLTLSTNATILHLKKFIKSELKLPDVDNVCFFFYNYFVFLLTFICVD